MVLRGYSRAIVIHYSTSFNQKQFAVPYLTLINMQAENQKTAHKETVAKEYNTWGEGSKPYESFQNNPHGIPFEQNTFLMLKINLTIIFSPELCPLLHPALRSRRSLEYELSRRTSINDLIES